MSQHPENAVIVLKNPAEANTDYPLRLREGRRPNPNWLNRPSWVAKQRQRSHNYRQQPTWR
jgi:hypothetical protein